jgi:hypothetical protein
MSKSSFARVVALVLVLGCASAPQGGNTGGAAGDAASQGATRIDSPWPIKTRSHVDLWLHGFAMVQEDTTKVPYFRRGYRDQMVVERNRTNISTMLDANRDKLRARFAVNRTLVNAQFLAFQFATWDEMQQFINLFIEAEGDPRRGNTQQTQQAIAFLAQSFPSAADRDWLRLFVTSLQDENNRFYRTYWTQQQRDRTPVIHALDSLFEKNYRPKLSRFLNNTQQVRGDFILSLPLNGEGRSISGGKNQNIITTTFPDRPADAIDAIYVFAHEAIGNVANQAVADNTTPSEQRSGAIDRLSSAALVRGGAMLLAKVAPDLVDGYARYYLRSANVSVGSDPQASLAAAFPLPETIRDAITRQLDVVLGGI